MSRRKIIKIDENRCNGCGRCIPNCPEGALKVIDGKVRLISDLFCDGLGACIGHCPLGAITIEEREAEKYDERKVMGNVINQGKNVIKEHLEHLRSHNESGYLKEATDFLKENGIEVPLEESTHHDHGFQGCPGSRVLDLGKMAGAREPVAPAVKGKSELRQWPVQIMLVPPNAPYFNNADLLIAADCVPFAYPDFHRELLRERILLVGCPKLDDVSVYRDKLGQIMKMNAIKSVTYAHMEVPCCYGLIEPLKEAIAASGRAIPFHDITIGIRGELSE